MSRSSSKRRHCPAVGRDISAGDCGENRISRYPCPGTCPHNPFAPSNYSQFLELESSLDDKCIEWLTDHTDDRRTLDRTTQEAMKTPSPEVVHALVAWDLLFQRDAAGLTCAERWERSGFADLKNDERVLLRAKMQMRIALIEVHRVFDTERTEVVDLLAPQPMPFVVQDRALAASAVRFGTALAWAYPLPHYWRLSGTATLLPAMAQFETKDIVLEIVRHLGGPADETGLRLWLAEHSLHFDAALTATCLARRRQMFAGIDAQIGKAVYELTCPLAECRGILDRHRAVADEELAKSETSEDFSEARVWFDESKQAIKVGGVRPVLGRVLLGEKRWRVEAMGGARLTALRNQLEKLLGKRLRFVAERRDDVGSQMALKDPKFDESLVPPRLLENPEKLLFGSSRTTEPIGEKSIQELEAEWLVEQDRAFLDQPIPALDGRTPRQAAGDLYMRPKLIRLLKNRVRMCDERNLEREQNHDLNWLLRELGANEIVFDPPPPRPATQPNGDFDGPDDEAIDLAEFPLAPPLPEQPFSLEEASERLKSGVAEFETAHAAMEALRAGGSTLLDDIIDVTGDLLDERECSYLVTFVLRVTFAMVPPGTRGPDIEFERLSAAVEREIKNLVKTLSTGAPQDMQRHLESGSQPALTQLIVAEMLEAAQRSPKKDRPRVEAQPIMIAVLKAVIDELDQELRRDGER